MSNQQTETKQMKNTTRHEGATAPLALGPRMIGSINYEGYLRYMEKQQIVWKIYFLAVLQDIREPNWREEEEEEELVRRECFKCNKIYYDVDYSCCCGKCCSYCRESDKKEEEEEEICETCNRHYDECETCECPNDAKCLVLCNRDKEDEEEKELKIIGYRPQTREGECSGCKSICEECENLIITEEEEEEEDYKYVKQYLKCSDEDLTDLIQTQYLEL